MMREGDTRLVDAARHGRAADVAALLAGGADVNEQNSDGVSSTPLIIACQEGQTEIVKKRRRPPCRSGALSREDCFAAYGPQAVVDAWMTFVVPQAVSRNRVQVVGIKGRPELNGQDGTIGEFYGAKGRFPVSLEGGESVLIKMMNLVAIGDDM
jgi:ankyrin repeat protein